MIVRSFIIEYPAPMAARNPDQSHYQTGWKITGMNHQGWPNGHFIFH